MKHLAGFAVATVFLNGCASHVAPKRTTFGVPAERVVAPKAGPDDLYPDPQFTPSVTNPDVTQANIKETICKSGWTATVWPPASYTNNLKKEGIAQHGYDDSKVANYEEDHFIPLEIGGNPKDPNNLWPEPYDTKIDGKTIGAHQKDKVEDLLKKRVCDGTITLQEAQGQITGDWCKIYLAHF